MIESIASMAPREAFAQALIWMAREDSDLVVLDSDVAVSTMTSLFADAFPDRFVEVGIAEQNMIGIASGLASVGKTVFACAHAVFITKRACDQVSLAVAYPRHNVKIVGSSCGIATTGGATHQSVEDIAIMRSIPNMVVVVPADGVETFAAVCALARHQGPAYLRIARPKVPAVFPEGHEFVLGKSTVLRDGDDVSLIATGIMTSKALEAAKILEQKAIQARVINMSSIKPIDAEAVLAAARETGAIVTVEDHSIIGGLGSAVAEVTAESCPVPVSRIGVRDTFGESGEAEEVLEKFGLTPEKIACEAEKLTANKAA